MWKSNDFPDDELVPTNQNSQNPGFQMKMMERIPDPNEDAAQLTPFS